MSKGLGFLQSNVQDMLQDGDTLTAAYVMEVADIGGSGRIGKHRGFEIVCGEVVTKGEAE